MRCLSSNKFLIKKMASKTGNIRNIKKALIGQILYHLKKNQYYLTAFRRWYRMEDTC